jgi:hypothetical protein
MSALGHTKFGLSPEATPYAADTAAPRVAPKEWIEKMK